VMCITLESSSNFNVLTFIKLQFNKYEQEIS
jgi:hypothetical protein